HELPGVSEMAVPSKLTSYFASGRPVIAATDPNGITAQVIRDANAGLVVESGNSQALIEAIELLLEDSELANELGRNGQAYARANLTEAAAVAKFSKLLRKLTFQNPANR
ncbi:MAG: glycosyltransferase, partial [Micrococcales bacterium]